MAMTKWKWEFALTDAMDWVNEPHRAPLIDQLAIGQEYKSSLIMRMQANLLDGHHDLYDREIRNKHDAIIFAWNLEANLREEGLLIVWGIVRCEHGHDQWRGDPEGAKRYLKKGKPCDTCGEPPMDSLVLEYKVM